MITRHTFLRAASDVIGYEAELTRQQGAPIVQFIHNENYYQFRGLVQLPLSHDTRDEILTLQLFQLGIDGPGARPWAVLMAYLDDLTSYRAARMWMAKSLLDLP